MGDWIVGNGFREFGDPDCQFDSLDTTIVGRLAGRSNLDGRLVEDASWVAGNKTTEKVV